MSKLITGFIVFMVVVTIISKLSVLTLVIIGLLLLAAVVAVVNLPSTTSSHTPTGTTYEPKGSWKYHASDVRFMLVRRREKNTA